MIDLTYREKKIGQGDEAENEFVVDRAIACEEMASGRLLHPMETPMKLD